MFDRIQRQLRTPPKLNWQDILWLLLPAALWAIIIHLRPALISLRCTQGACGVDTVFWLDRMGLRDYDPRADELSFLTQYMSGGLAIFVPVLWIAFNKKNLFPRWSSAILAMLMEWLLMIQATVWNGVLNEIAHQVVQRPRPFVYADPSNQGLNPASYTSFYSGHTSFAAASCTMVLIMLMGRRAPQWLLAIAGFSGIVLTALTGLFRVAAARHFPTDVLAGALAGMIIAVILSLLHRKNAAAAD